MPRSPKPWYWTVRGAWYVQLNGKQVRLAPDKKEAEREFYRIMAAEGRLDEKAVRRMTVADACEALIASTQHLRANTRRQYEEKLGLFASAFGPRRLETIRPPEVIHWIHQYRGAKPDKKPFGDPSRALLFRFVKTLFKWARDTGLIEMDPFVRVASPWRIPRRSEPMSEEDYEKIMLLPRTSPQLKEIVEFMWRTGMRPGELSVLAARHLDARLPIARFQPTEHKTGTKTGLQREVYFPSDLWERLKKKAEIHRQGPLFRRPSGKPWTAKIISELFNRMKKRNGLTCVLYQARHSWATNLVDGGIPAERVAKMAGHTRTHMLLSTYYKHAAHQMAEDIEQASAAEKERVRRIAEEVEKRRAEARERQRRYGAEWKRRKQRRERLNGESSDT